MQIQISQRSPITVHFPFNITNTQIRVNIAEKTTSLGVQSSMLISALQCV